MANEVLVMSTKELIGEIAKKTGYSKKDVSAVLATMETTIVNALKEAKDGTNVNVKLMSGVSFTSEYKEACQVRRPSDGVILDKPAGITAKVKATKTFKNIVNA